LDYFANPHMIVPNGADIMTEIYQAAKRAIASFGVLTPGELQVYARVYLDYRTYMETLVLLAHAVEKLRQGQYVLALQSIICTKSYADRLLTRSFGAGSVDLDFVLGCYRSIAMHLSEQTVKEILATTNDQDVVDKVKMMKTQLLPCLIELYHQHHDSGTLESVRAGWFAAVVDEQNVLPEAKSHEMKEFLEALMEVETATKDGKTPAMNAKIKLQPDFGPRFDTALRQAREFGILQCHHDAKIETQTSVPAAASSSKQ